MVLCVEAQDVRFKYQRFLLKCLHESEGVNQNDVCIASKALKYLHESEGFNQNDVCIVFGVEEPLYRMRFLTRVTSLLQNATHMPCSSTSINEEEEGEQEFKGPEIELSDFEAFDLLNITD